MKAGLSKIVAYLMISSYMQALPSEASESLAHRESVGSWLKVDTIKALTDDQTGNYGSMYLTVDYTVAVKPGDGGLSLKELASQAGKWLADQLEPDVKTIVLTATFNVGGQELPAIPFYAATLDDGNNKWSASNIYNLYVTPFIPIDPSKDPVDVTIKVLRSKVTNSKIGATTSAVSDVLGAFQPTGRVLQLLAKPSIAKAGLAIDRVINQSLSESADLTFRTQVSTSDGQFVQVEITDNNGGEIRFRFAPVFRPSVMSSSPKVPLVFEKDDSKLLSYHYGPNKQPLGTYIDGNADLVKLFKDRTDTANSISQYCDDVSDLLASEVGFNRVDRAAVLWAKLQRHPWWSGGAARLSSADDRCTVRLGDLNGSNLASPVAPKPPI